MSRYIPNTKDQQGEMLRDMSYSSMDDLLVDIAPELRLKGDLDLPKALTEYELLRYMKELSNKNLSVNESICFLGAGAYDHQIPLAIDHLISRAEFYTSYTPYQPEISQGTLQSIFEYQTMICELTGMDVANASLYDGATGLAESILMACAATRRSKVLMARSVNPKYRKVAKTYAKFQDVEIEEVGYIDGFLDIDSLKNSIDDKTAAIAIQTPNFFGIVEDIKAIADIAHENKALLIVSVDPISLGLLEAPGKLGADIVVGEGQSLGNPLSYGGPYLGFFATSSKLMRRMPGRVVGETQDKDGNRGFVLTMQTREQHIRREKATSNICTNQALNALIATIYLALMGKDGFRDVSEQSFQKAHYLYDRLIETDLFSPAFEGPFFKEFALISKIPVDRLNKELKAQGIIGGYPLERDYPELKNGWLLAVTEKRSKFEMDLLLEKVGEL